jgi:hypothetical protein
MLATDKEVIYDSLTQMIPAGEVFEMRILDLKGRRGTMHGYFDDLHLAAEAAVSWSGRAGGIYITLNPVKRALLNRAANRLKEAASGDGTKDHEIDRRVWLPVDFDVRKPEGIMSTDAEKLVAYDRAMFCGRYLKDQGWPEPLGIDSGNGYHLLYPIDLPVNDESRDLLVRVLTWLSHRFSDDLVKIDEGMFNASRIWKLPGTIVAKGDSTPERPHRISQIIHRGSQADQTQRISQELLRIEAERMPQPDVDTLPREGRQYTYPLEEFIAKHLHVLYSGTWNGGTKWVLAECPWNPVHTDKSAYVLRFKNGAIAAGCMHNSCRHRRWSDLRDMYDPKPQAGYLGHIERFHITKPKVQVTQSTGLAKELQQFGDILSPDQEPLIFPHQVFPTACIDLMTIASNILPCPISFIGTSMLTVMGAALGRMARLQLQPTWYTTPIFYAVLVGNTGTKKTPAMKVGGMDLILSIQEQRKAQWELEKAAWESDMERFKDDKKAGRVGVHPGLEPRFPHHFTTDATIEALASICEHSNGILNHADEATDWIGSANAYRGGKGGDRQKWLSLWSGSTLKIDRVGSPIPKIIRNPHVCVLGGCPPDMISLLAEEAGRQDGFTDRIIWDYPEDILDQWIDYDSTVFLQVESVFKHWLEQAAMPRLAAPLTFKLSSDARKLWRVWYNANADLTRRVNRVLRGNYAKMSAHTARIALTLHCLHGLAEYDSLGSIDTEIGVDILAGAIALAEYYRTQAAKVCQTFIDMGMDRPASMKHRVLEACWQASGEWVSTETLLKYFRGSLGAVHLLRHLAALMQDSRVEHRKLSDETSTHHQWRPVPEADRQVDLVPDYLNVDQLLQRAAALEDITVDLDTGELIHDTL